MPSIFISYRREDAAGDAGRLADHLNRRFGADRVFLDIDTIAPGLDFVRVLRESLEQTAVVLVVIGRRWTTVVDEQCRRRLDSEDDFVRMEVEAALARNIPVIPVLVQGASMPREEDVPASMAPLVRRQAFSLDHAEFHADVERLCDRLAKMIDGGGSDRWAWVRRWWPAAAIAALLAAGVAGYRAMQAGDAGRAGTAAGAGSDGGTSSSAADQARVDALVQEALVQRRRNQLVEALATLARARELAPGSAVVQRTQEDVAMEWIRDVRIEGDSSSFGDAIKPALAVVDAALPNATGERRADLLAHSGWATFLMWRDGNRSLDPTGWYREALMIDPLNPYANAMLAHWTLLRDDDVPRAAELFATALRSGRAVEAVRTLQWGGYGNTRTPESDAERVRLADAMRRNGERLNASQAQALWAPYFFALSSSRDEERRQLLAALPPDDHISTLSWAFEEYAAGDESRRRTIRFYEALLHAEAGRPDRAREELQALNKELARSPGSLGDAVQAALMRLARGAASAS